MRRCLILGFVLMLSAVVPSFALSVIDFESQAAGAGPFLTGIPDAPLTIGIATFQGGELRVGEIGLTADQTGVYATEGVFGSDSNPLLIQFSIPVSGFSVFVANGDNTATYTVSDNVGDTVSASLPSAGASGSETFSLSGAGITSVSIGSSNANGWNFAIDNVTFTATPEPLPIGMGALGLIALGWVGRRRTRRCK